jgi:hypothetical protein
MVNEIPNGPKMIFELFGKRECLSYQARDSLAKGTIEALNSIGFATVLVDWTVSFRWNDPNVSLPKICVTNSTLPINSRQRIP